MLSNEKVLVELIHDLSQPLGNIETSAYCLERCLDAGNPRAHEYLRLIQQQVEQACGMLAAASAELARAKHVEHVATFEMAAAASH